MPAFDLSAFSRENRTRCESPVGFNHKLDSWSLSDWMTATAGELGEAANVAKKLNRVRDGIPGNAESEATLRANLADEIADAFIYLDLMAQSQGIDLGVAVRSKFDRTSKKIGYEAGPAKASGPDNLDGRCSYCGGPVPSPFNYCPAGDRGSACRVL
jgi:NTP pyrophosphatase (non-canonical NTP hydrolase)